MTLSKDPIHWIRTHCSRMDHGGCALLVGVSGNAIVKIKGDPDGYLNRGYACLKGMRAAERLTHPDRLRHPLRRTGARGGGRWERISWETALAAIAERLLEIRERHGARAVAFCQGMPKGLEHFALIRLANLFGSPNLVAVQDVCHAPREITGLHTCGFYPVADFHNPTSLVVLWGSNITATNEEGMIASGCLRSLAGGADLMVVDPFRTELAERAALWLPVRPGADAALALSMLHVIIGEGLYDADFVENHATGFADLAAHVAAYPPERGAALAGVSAEDIVSAARLYARSRPAAIQWGNAIEQSPSNFDAARALICLMAICGNLDAPGGNIHAEEPPALGLGPFVRADRIPNKRKEMIHAHHGAIHRLMTVPPTYFKRAVLTGKPYPVKAAYVQCSNPLITWANSPETKAALMALDFIAVSELFMTPTAALADIVLPAATGFEFDDIGHYGLGHGILLARPRAVEPPPECRPDLDILTRLGAMITDPADWPADGAGLIEAALAPAGLDFAAFAEKGYLKGPERYYKYREKGFSTPDGKVALRLDGAVKMGLSPLPEYREPPAAPDFPLILTSAKDPCYLHSSYRWMTRLREKSPRPLARLHPDTARDHGIADGDPIRVETPLGAIIQNARVTDRARPGVVVAAYGWWFPEASADALYDWDRANYNMLTDTETVGKAFGTPALKGIPCRIAPVDGLDGEGARGRQ